MHFAVYDPKTGAIVRFGQVSAAADAAIQNRDDPSLEVALGECSDLSHYVVDGAITERPAFGLDSVYRVAAGATLALAVPAGASVTVDGVGEETVDATGFVFEAGMPDTYRATVSLWPYVDQTIEIEVTP